MFKRTMFFDIDTVLFNFKDSTQAVFKNKNVRLNKYRPIRITWPWSQNRAATFQLKMLSRP